MKNFVIIRNLLNVQHAAPLEELALVTIQERARELTASTFGALAPVLVGVVRATDESRARVARTVFHRILWLYWFDGVQSFEPSWRLTSTWPDSEVIDPVDALMRWAREISIPAFRAFRIPFPTAPDLVIQGRPIPTESSQIFHSDCLTDVIDTVRSGLPLLCEGSQVVIVDILGEVVWGPHTEASLAAEPATLIRNGSTDQESR